ncbi:MAG TPA: type II toxin-antitoxin system VapC family toxin [Solirubrobacterales bacterium]|nr:type II toxin-antitoxin system VapC family toxin [Solirubrobacterales bacterium]
MKLLDTSVAIDHLRGSPSAVNLLSGLLKAEEFLLASEVVRFELLAGVREKEVDALEEFFAAISWVPVGEEIARAAGALAQRHRRSHSGIDNADYLIAATALLLEADLLTTNVRHFPMITGLEPAY